MHACLEHASLAAAGRHVLRRCKRHSRTLLPQTRGAATRRDHERLRKRGRQQDGRPEQEARHIHTHGVKRNDLVSCAKGRTRGARICSKEGGAAPKGERSRRLTLSDKTTVTAIRRPVSRGVGGRALCLHVCRRKQPFPANSRNPSASLGGRKMLTLGCSGHLISGRR